MSLWRVCAFVYAHCVCGFLNLSLDLLSLVDAIVKCCVGAFACVIALIVLIDTHVRSCSKCCSTDHDQSHTD